MKVMIVDDELPSIDLMLHLLRKYEQFEIMGTYSNSNEALRAIKNNVPDVLFLDIEMPQMSGLELAKEVMQLHDRVQIVFVTAYSQYALEAFNVNAVHYLLKPISEAKLINSIQRLTRNYGPRIDDDVTEKVYRIEVFGEFKVYGRSQLDLVKWPTQKVKELFSYFVCHKNMEVDKWQLCEILWPASTRDKVEHNLHSTFSRLKQSLKNVGITDIVSCTKGKYKINLEVFTCDLWEFEQLILKNPIIDRMNVNHYEAMIPHLAAKVWPYEDYVWITDKQGYWSECYLNALRQLIQYYTDNNTSNKIEQYSRAYLEHDPFDEYIQIILMEHYAKRGKYKEISQLYTRYTDLLHELDLEPSIEIKEKYDTLFPKKKIN